MHPKNLGIKRKHLAKAAAYSFFKSVIFEPPASRDPDLAPDPDIIGEHKRLIAHVREKFAAYANVADYATFSELFRNPLRNWTVTICDSKSDDPLLHRARRDAKSLRKQLKLLEAHPTYASQLTELSIMRTEPWLDVVRQDWLPNISKTICLLIDGLDTLIAPGFLPVLPKGPLSEIDGYPGLGPLVFSLEHAAQLSGGKFTVQRRHGEKGRLIQALDELQRSLAMTRWGGSLADCLPCADEHPIAKYERLIQAARKKVAARAAG
jgi:hypothetical protein